MNQVPYNKVPHITTVQEMALNSARTWPNNLAMEDLQDYPINRLTFQGLLDTILKFGPALQKLGLEERAHIAIIGENRVQWALSFLTGLCFNYVVVPIDAKLTGNEITNILHESDSEAVIFSESFSDVLSEHAKSLKKLKYYICMEKISSEKHYHCMADMINAADPVGIDQLPKINPDEMAEVLFTSGSLGRSKGVMLSQGNVAANLEDMVSMIMMYPTDRFLSVLPIHHTYECTCGVLCPLYSGASVHFARSLKSIGEDMQKVKPTVFLGVPLLYDKLYKRISKAISEDKVKSVVVPGLVSLTNLLRSFGAKDIKKKIFKEMHERFGGALRMFIVGGAAADPKVSGGLQSFGFTFLQGYGLTETSPILTVNRLEHFRDDAAGLPLPRVELKINDPDEEGNGEIWAKGPNVMLGYYKNELQTEEAFDDGWFKTGDLGFIDENGFLHIRGRKKNVIISRSGKNVFPEEIEDLLTRSPYILECVVYGEKDVKQDEVIAVQLVTDADAFIALSEEKGITIDDGLIQKIVSEEINKVNKQLAAYKHIKHFNIREQEFEKTTTQKIKRYLVKT